MVLLNIQDNPNLGVQIQKTSVVFTGLRHKKRAVAYPARSAQLRHSSSDQERGRNTGFFKNISEPGTGCAFSVCAGHCYPFVLAEKSAKHLGIFVNPNPQFSSPRQFRVACRHGGTNHHSMRIRGNLFRPMSNIYLHPGFLELSERAAFCHIGTRDNCPLLEQHLSQAAGADSANSNKMKLPAAERFHINLKPLR